MSQEQLFPFRPDAMTQSTVQADEQFTLDKFRAFALLPAFWLLVLLVVGVFLWLLTWETAVFTQTQAYYLEPVAAEPALAIALPAEQLSSFTADQTVVLRLESDDEPVEARVIQILPAASGLVEENTQWQSRLPTSPDAAYLIVAFPSQWPIPQTTLIPLYISLGQKTLFQILFAPE